jgi:hypothetical protein
MRKILFILILTSVIFTFGSCNDPIFMAIHDEPPRTKARIPGSPTNMVVYEEGSDEFMYVASGSSLYKYLGTNSSGSGVWERTTLENRIVQLASTTKYLYALMLDSRNNRDRYIWQYDYNGGSSTSRTVRMDINVQSIFAAGTVLFICEGTGTGTSNTTYYFNDSSGNLVSTPASTVASVTSLLKGVALSSSTFYLCTEGGGIFHTNSGSLNSATLIPGSSSDFMGIIALEGSNGVVAIDRIGDLYSVTTGSISHVASFPDRNRNRPATGALGLWADGSSKLLLAGRSDRFSSSVSSGLYGYLELTLSGTGAIIDSRFREPGRGSPTTVSDNGRYRSTIGTNPVIDIFQADDTTLFASTQTSGLWSYRPHNGQSIHWNAEE